jgi:spherulation-specific family 4 protein/flagellar hook capping protein FlgD
MGGHANLRLCGAPKSRRAIVWSVLALGSMTAVTPSLARPEPEGIIVPAYQDPTSGTLWEECARASSRVPLVAVMNPANGPGSEVDPNYVSAAGSVRSAGGRVIGYVYTSAAEVPLDSVLTEVDRYREWYALDGIFLDGMANDSNPAHVAWYATLRDSIRAREPAWLVVGCPGTNTSPEYLAGADILCIVESEGEGYFDWEPSAWVREYPPSRFLHLVHTLSSADSMRQAVARAGSRGAGWVYVTDDRLANPWDETPTYWDALIQAVEATVVSVETTGRAGARIRAWPNPARRAIRFELPADAGAREIEIRDASGRLVARITPGPFPEWDGYDRRGRPAPAGIYFARVRGSRAEPVRLALVR